MGYLLKLKKDMGLAFDAYFLHDLIKNVPYLIFYHLTKLQCQTFFSSQDIKQNVRLSYYLATDDVINFKIYLRSCS